MTAVNPHLTTDLTTAPNAAPAKPRGKRSPWDFDTGVQYLVKNREWGVYYARARIGGRVIRRSLGTKVLREAKTALATLLAQERAEAEFQRHRGPEERPDLASLGAATREWLHLSGQDPTIADSTREFRAACVVGIRRTWAGWDSVQVGRLTSRETLAWASRVAAEVSPGYYNQLVTVARTIAKVAADESGTSRTPGWKNPFDACKRLGVKPKSLVLPEPARFREILNWIDAQASSGEAQKLVRLFAFCGLRVSEAQRAVWGDFDWANGELVVKGAKGRKISSRDDIRRVPLIPEAAAYFKVAAEGRAAHEPVAGIDGMRFWLRGASKALSIPMLTHHDFRHLFATRCIESGVDIPTVSRWLGHKDGGALAMRVYGHLRRAHSVEAARRVVF